MVPPDHWFAIDTLTMSLNEPLELEILPDGNLLFIERGGMVKMYDQVDKKVDTIGTLPVIASESNGLSGLAIDPQFGDIIGFIFQRIRFSEGREVVESLELAQTAREAWDELLPLQAGFEEGRSILLNQTCFTCHEPHDKTIGPSFSEIAERFIDEKFALAYLPKKIMKGGTGNWPGNIIMPANPLLSIEEANAIAGLHFEFQ